MHPTGPSDPRVWGSGLLSSQTVLAWNAHPFAHCKPRVLIVGLFPFLGELAEPWDENVLRPGLLREPRTDGTGAGEQRFLVVTVARAISSQGLREAGFTQRISFLPHNETGSLFTDEGTHDGLKGNVFLSTPE